MVVAVAAVRPTAWLVRPLAAMLDSKTAKQRSLRLSLGRHCQGPRLHWCSSHCRVVQHGRTRQAPARFQPLCRPQTDILLQTLGFAPAQHAVRALASGFLAGTGSVLESFTQTHPWAIPRGGCEGAQDTRPDAHSGIEMRHMDGLSKAFTSIQSTRTITFKPLFNIT